MLGRSVILATLFLGKPPGGRLPVLSAHSLAINWQMLFLNQWKRKNGRRNIFMIKSSWKNVPGVRIDRSASWFPSNIAANQAISLGYIWGSVVKIKSWTHSNLALLMWHQSVILQYLMVICKDQITSAQRPCPNFDALRMWNERGRLDTPRHRLNLHIKGLTPYPYLRIFGHCMTKNQLIK